MCVIVNLEGSGMFISFGDTNLLDGIPRGTQEGGEDS